MNKPVFVETSKGLIHLGSIVRVWWKYDKGNGCAWLLLQSGEKLELPEDEWHLIYNKMVANMLVLTD